MTLPQPHAAALLNCLLIGGEIRLQLTPGKADLFQIQGGKLVSQRSVVENGNPTKTWVPSKLTFNEFLQALDLVTPENTVIQVDYNTKLLAHALLHQETIDMVRLRVGLQPLPVDHSVETVEVPHL